MYQQLAQLIRDAVWLKSYIAAVMRLEQEAFQSAYASLGPSKATLPLQQEMPAQSEQMMMTTGSTISQPMYVAPQVTNESCHRHQLLPSWQPLSSAPRVYRCNCRLACAHEGVVKSLYANLFVAA